MIRFSLTALASVCLLTASLQAATPAEWIETIRSVGREGEGHPQAVAAVRELSQADASAAIPVLQAMQGANPLARNWLQGAFEAIADRTASDGTLAAETLEAFVTDRTGNARARRLAYEWLVRIDPDAEARLIPGMLDDPSRPLRRDAVAHVIEQAREAEGEQAQLSLWQKALGGAVDEDQVKLIANKLKELGEPVNLARHFGMLTEWHLIGPFDNREMGGFDVVYPPEREIDLDAEYEGMEGTVRWQAFATEDEMGVFDIAELTHPHKGAITYAYSEFVSDASRQVEFRLATPNAWKLWLNGELLFAREEYHRGMRFDQYIVPAELQAGENILLLKVCQNEQTQDWAQKWGFQFRVCDPTGRAVHPVSAE
jgi:hypothetical protein